MSFIPPPGVSTVDREIIKKISHNTCCAAEDIGISGLYR